MNKTMQNAVNTAPRGTSGLIIEPWTPGETYGVAADWSQAAGPVFAFGDRGWEPTPHQVADFSHRPASALEAELRNAMIASAGDGAETEAGALVTDATEF